MLVIRGVSVSYGAIRALSDISLRVEREQIICVLGPNGAGKTTLLSAISGQVGAMTGEISADGLPLSELSPVEVARRGIVLCPEGRRLFASLTVEENIKLGAWRRRQRFAEVRKDLDSLFSLFPVLRERWRQPAGTLSGGEQQMVALARSVVARPSFLLLDEPALGLAPRMVKEVFRKLPEIASLGVGILLVEQHARAALEVASRAYLLRHGRVIEQLPAADMATLLAQNAGYLGASTSPTTLERLEISRTLKQQRRQPVAEPTAEELKP